MSQHHTHQRRRRSAGAAAVALLLLCSQSRGEDYPEQAQDQLIVETVMRLEGFDLNASAKGKAAVLRYLQHDAGSERFFELVRKFPLAEADPLLLKLAAEKPDETAGVEAARHLLRGGDSKTLAEAITAEDGPVAGLATALGLTGDRRAVEFVAPLITGEKRPLAVRGAATTALGRLPGGEAMLLDLVKDGKLPDDLQFTVANVLHASNDAEIRAAANKLLQLPATADAAPLPPLAQLIAQAGDSARGHEIFRTKGTCIKCHQIGGEGKQVGPSLAEIGSKLTREAMFVSILDPSAGISHNFESYQAILHDGTIFTGLLISETDDSVTLKSAEAIERIIPKSDIEELLKQKISLMPADLQKTMTAQELVDVVQFLATLKKPSE